MPITTWCCLSAPCIGEDTTAKAIFDSSCCLQPLEIRVDRGDSRSLVSFLCRQLVPGAAGSFAVRRGAKTPPTCAVFFGSLSLRYDDTRVRPWNSHNIRERKGGECDTLVCRVERFVSAELYPDRLSWNHVSFEVLQPHVVCSRGQ